MTYWRTMVCHTIILLQHHKNSIALTWFWNKNQDNTRQADNLLWHKINDCLQKRPLGYTLVQDKPNYQIMYNLYRAMMVTHYEKFNTSELKHFNLTHPTDQCILVAEVTLWPFNLQATPCCVLQNWTHSTSSSVWFRKQQKLNTILTVKNTQWSLFPCRVHLSQLDGNALQFALTEWKQEEFAPCCSPGKLTCPLIMMSSSGRMSKYFKSHTVFFF